MLAFGAWEYLVTKQSRESNPKMYQKVLENPKNPKKSFQNVHLSISIESPIHYHSSLGLESTETSSNQDDGDPPEHKLETAD